MMGLSLTLRLALIALAAITAREASAKSDTNGTWLYPDPDTNPTFNYLDSINASWTSDFSTPWLHLWCGVLNPNSSSPNLGEPINKTAPATGSQLVPLSQIFPLRSTPQPFSCHFELSRNPSVGEGPPFALGKDFYVTIDNNAKPVTWTQGTVNASATGTASSAATTAESPASPTPTAHASGSSSGLSQGAKIGIGVGVALGVLALIAVAAAAFLWLRRRRKARMARTDNTYEAYGSQLPVEKYGSSKVVRSEMPADSQVHEKDSAPVAVNTIGELEAPR